MNNKDKKKILIATAFPTHGAGSGALVTTQAKSYVEDGHTVVIITGNNRTTFDKLDGVKYHIVPFTSEVDEPEKIDGQVPFNYLMFTTHTESTANFWNIGLDELEQYCKTFKKALQEEINTFNPDVIHAQHNWLLSSEATRMNKPVVTTIHGTDLMGYEKAKTNLDQINEKITALKQDSIIRKVKEIFSNTNTNYSGLVTQVKAFLETPEGSKNKKKIKEAINLFSEQRKYAFYINEAENSAQKSNKIIVISQAQKEKFISLFPFAAHKIELLENGYDPKTFYVDTTVSKEEVFQNLESNITADGRISKDYSNLILFVGKFADFKGIDSLLTANKLYDDKLKKQGKKPLTIIVGSGDLDKKLKAQAKKLKLDNTHFVGRKDHTTIRQLQNLATVSLIPSRNEPFGLVVIEGTACGHPVIGSNSGGIPGIMNISKKTLPNDDIIPTPLGILVKPLPERPQLSDENKDFLDLVTPDYVLGNEGDKTELISNMSKKLKITPEELKNYFDEYTSSTEALAQAVEKICNGQLSFDNKEIADYTKRVYSQPKIRDELLQIFDAAEEDYKINLEK